MTRKDSNVQYYTKKICLIEDQHYILTWDNDIVYTVKS